MHSTIRFLKPNKEKEYEEKDPDDQHVWQKYQNIPSSVIHETLSTRYWTKLQGHPTRI